MLNKYGKKYLAAFAVINLILISSNLRVSLAAVERTWNIYQLTLDKLTFDLGRGQTVQLQVEVMPPDQELTFVSSDPGVRIDVSVDPNTGRYRTVEVRDLTSEGDGSSNTPAKFDIKVRLPDGTIAKKPNGEEIICGANLLKPFYERVVDGIKHPGSELQLVLDQVPGLAHTLIEGGARTNILDLSQATLGQPPPAALVDFWMEAADPQIVDWSNVIGQTAGAESEIAVKTSDVSEGSTLVPRDAPPLVPVGDNKVVITLQPSFDGYKLKFLDGNSGPKHTFDDFMNGRPINLSRAIVVTGTTAHLNATLKTADLKISFEGQYRLHNFAGGEFNELDRSKIIFSLDYHFGPSGGR